MADRRRARAAVGAALVAVAFLAGRRTGKASPPPSPDGKDRFDLAKVSYDEVLDATKHQDDKVGRFLTAIAFLTGAAVAFGTRADVLAAHYDVDGSIPLPAILFAGFIVFVVVAVLFLLMALGQAVRPPGSGKQSYLFFFLIARMAQDDWKARWSSATTAGELRRRITDDLIVESHNLAVRAEKKYRRTGEAQALFTVALLLFGLAAALAVNALTASPTTDIPWDLRARLLAAGVLTSFAFALGYEWLRAEQAATREWSKPQFYGLWLTGAALPPALVVWQADAAAVAVAVVLLAEGWCWVRCLPPGNALRWLMAALAVALAGGAAWAVLADSDRWRLTLAIVSISLYELPRLLSATFRPAPVRPSR